MIGNYTLAMLCEKYGIDATKIVKKNNNVLDLGEYSRIDYVLDYLVNELKIDARNIEKCPSILYRNVFQIKKNVLFLKSKDISFSDIETCLHVLTTEVDELKNTYNYVLENYGLSVIERITSVLSVPVSIIKDIESLNIGFENPSDNLGIAVGIEWGSTNVEEIVKIINSEEFKAHPELFTSTTLAHAKLEDIKAIINSEEFKAHPELFTSQTLAHAKLEDIKAIINSEEFKAHPELFTSETLAHAKLEDIKAIINSEEFKAHPELFTSQTLAHAKLEDIKAIINSEEFKAHPELFTSETLAHAKLEDIKAIINSEEFKNYPELFTSQTLARTKLEDIKAIINSEEFKTHPELFTSTTLAHAKLEDIKAIINSEEFKAHPELFTSTTLASTKLEDIKAIITSEEFKAHPELFTSQTLAYAKLEDIKAIINSEEFKAYPELFTSQTLAHAKLEDIKKLLQMDLWNNSKYANLLTSSIVAKSKQMLKKIPILIKLAENYGFEECLNTNFLLHSPSQNYALIRYLKENDIPLTINGKLNSIFGYQPGVIKKKYNIDLNILMDMYPFNEQELYEKEGLNI